MLFILLLLTMVRWRYIEARDEKQDIMIYIRKKISREERRMGRRRQLFTLYVS